MDHPVTNYRLRPDGRLLSPPRSQHLKALTKTVNPKWYFRYAKVLPENERLFVQPTEELLHDTKLKRRLGRKATEGSVYKSRRPTDDSASDLSSGKISDHKDVEHMKFSIAALRYRKGRKLPKKSKWRILQTNEIVKLKLKKMIETRKTNAIQYRWRKSIRIVRAILRFWNFLSKNLSAGQLQVNKNDIPQFREESDKLRFNKSNYENTSTLKLQLDTQITLSTLVRLRSEESVCNAVANLRDTYISFAGFPVDFQKRIASVGFYVEIPKDKSIIRQGHQPNYFYFLLTGKAVAVKLDGSPVCNTDHCPGTFKVTKIISSGEFFGDEGIFCLDNVYRRYTVCASEPSKLLSINMDDFYEIASKCNDNEIPEQLNFLSKMDIFRTVPLDRIVDSASTGHIVYYYFAPGRVVTPNTWKSKYIYVVRTGSCQMLTQLITPDTPKTHRSVSVLIPPTESGAASESTASEMDALGLHLAPGGGFNLYVIQASPRVSSINEDSFEDRIQSEMNLLEQKETEDLLKLGSGNTIASASTSHKKMVQASVSRSLSRDSRSRGSRSMSVGSHQSSTGRSPNRSKERRKSMASQDHLANIEVSSVQLGSALSAAVEKVVMRHNSHSNLPTTTTTWVHLKDLMDGDVIGLEDMDFGDDKKKSNVAVVSNGAEVIAIAKRFLKDSMDPQACARMRALAGCFPDGESLKKELKRVADWVRFRDDTHVKLAERIETEKKLKL